MNTQMTSQFEGSYLGDDSKITDQTKMECKICWYVYEPAKGDPFWQVPKNTPFTQVGDDWRCPNCDAPKDQFMVLNEDE